MASRVNKSKIITPYMPSLFHLSVIQVAAPIFSKFGCRTLTTAFEDIQRCSLLAPNEGRQESGDVNFIRAKESLLRVPWPFREKLMEAVINMRHAVAKWRADHTHIFGFEVIDCDFFWRADGTLDRTKTAEKLVLNKDIAIRKRFDVACKYSLGDNMHALWAEVEEAGEAETFEKIGDELVHFWVGWIRDGSAIPWSLAILQYVDYPWTRIVPMPRFSSIFPLLRPEERRKFLSCLHTTSLDDIRLCLHMVNKKEEKKILQANILGVLLVYLETWPLQSKFLETAEKVRKHIDAYSFCVLLKKILKLKRRRKDIDFNGIFDAFWSKSSEAFKEYAKEWSENSCYRVYREIILRYF